MDKNTSSNQFRVMSSCEESKKCFCDPSVHYDFCNYQFCSSFSAIYSLFYFLIGLLYVKSFYNRFKNPNKNFKSLSIPTLNIIGSFLLVAKQILQFFVIPSTIIHSGLYMAAISCIISSYMLTAVFFLRDDVLSKKIFGRIKKYKYYIEALLLVWYILQVFLFVFGVTWKATNIIILIYILILLLLFFIVGIVIYKKKSQNCNVQGLDPHLFIKFDVFFLFCFLFILFGIFSLLIGIFGTSFNNKEETSKVFFVLYRLVILLYYSLPLVFNDGHGVILLKVFKCFATNIEPIEPIDYNNLRRYSIDYSNIEYYQQQIQQQNNSNNKNTATESNDSYSADEKFSNDRNSTSSSYQVEA
ncbi:hypothetical protein DICPUDRAFT_74313 [Dictyostelium purpureum]|uniref:Uncharacterized protein n=1 Tax=Dictyostelium purpureum TaxID=5786 RepID=F0Z7D3_DICPU|nr:uncharacterized protein DICPUDRAFT_74313 [Dictyostelium purpureum]EGC40158.1 hypothetical protein DICPUDRAFT_74313 [Dictyostelium purpureum]|eukprot:XP_003283348.1 hypothetical protein DICPUDRAFT_74313 [Dictyostelium purpureum]